MQLTSEILSEIKQRIKSAEPEATIILYGSYARGDANEESDVDLLILLNREILGYNEKIKITSPLFDLGFDIGQMISPLVQTKQNWETKYFYTPLYHNIKKEGIEI